MNVCIFAYGQTGSGKTYTMEGPCIQDPSMDGSFVDENMQIHYKSGILPRVALFLQAEIEKYQKYGKEMKIEVSALEIYCENIRDLLNPSDSNVYCELKTSSASKVRCVG